MNSNEFKKLKRKLRLKRIKKKFTFNNLKVLTGIIISITTIVLGVQTYKLTRNANELTKENIEVVKDGMATDFFVTSNNDKILIEATDGRATNITTKVYYNFSLNDTKYQVIDTENYKKQKGKENTKWSFIHANFDYSGIANKVSDTLNANENDKSHQQFCLGSKVVEISYIDYNGNLKRKFYKEQIMHTRKSDVEIKSGKAFEKIFLLSSESDELNSNIKVRHYGMILPESKEKLEKAEQDIINGIVDFYK